MKLTPLDIRHKEFRRVMRGYADEEVDVFLDEVADEFERLFQENMELRERREQLMEQVRQHEALKETLQNTLVSAQRQSDEMRANARKEAELIIKDAEIKGRDLLSESYAEKQRTQQSLTLLKQAEEDFRFKFRSLLEAHLNLLAEDEGSDERRAFRSFVSDVESESKGRAAQTSTSPPPASPSTAVAPEFRVVGAAPDAERSEGLGSPEDVNEYLGVRDTPVRDEFVDELERELVGRLIGSEQEREPEVEEGPKVEAEPESEGVVKTEAEDEVEVSIAGTESGEDADSSAGQRESSVHRFLFGRKDKSDHGDLSAETEDRDFEW